ncbi:MAG: hypothetical protein JW888_18220 [Pirellulales bacterium]|nr:hypothetical protein [Pirellulales bacterium]
MKNKLPGEGRVMLLEITTGVTTLEKMAMVPLSMSRDAMANPGQCVSQHAYDSPNDDFDDDYDDDFDDDFDEDFDDDFDDDFDEDQDDDDDEEDFDDEDDEL